MKIIHIDMDGVLADYNKRKTESLERNPGILYPQCEYDFFRKLEPIKGALEAVNALKNSSLYDPYIATRPSQKNPLSYTEKRMWTEEVLGEWWIDRLQLVPHKELLKGDYLIDDNVEGAGQSEFEGELIHFASEKFPSWEEVIRYLGP